MTCSVHDSIWFELQGIPSVFVLSTPFVSAAETQAEALGLPQARRVFVQHPIQDASDDEMRSKASAIVDELLTALSEN